MCILYINDLFLFFSLFEGCFWNCLNFDHVLFFKSQTGMFGGCLVLYQRSREERIDCVGDITSVAACLTLCVHVSSAEACKSFFKTYLL